MKQSDDGLPRKDRRSLPARGAWVETNPLADVVQHRASLPARGAWVETPIFSQIEITSVVAPRKGSVG